LARSLYHMSRHSGVSFSLDLLSDYQAVDWIQEVADRNNQEILDLFFYGGEELAVIFTASTNKTLPDAAIQLGYVGEGTGVFYKGNRVRDQGWDHFLDK